MMRNIIALRYCKKGRCVSKKLKKMWLKLKLNSRNAFRTINIRRVPIIPFGESTVQRTKKELENLDRKTYKLITMHGQLTRKINVQRICISRNEERRGLINVNGFLDNKSRSVTRYDVRNTEQLVSTVAEELNLDRLSKKKRSDTRLHEWQKEALHGYFSSEANRKAF